jgi:hypothetical protein
MTRLLRVAGVVLAMLLVGFVSSGSAASVTIGQTGTDASGTCFIPAFIVPTGVSGGASYTVPGGTWTLSQWSTLANGAGGSMSALVFRATATPGSYSVVGASSVKTLTPSVLNTFTADIKVKGGDILGLWVSAGTGCGFSTGNGADTYRFVAPVASPPSVGSVVTTTFTATTFRINIKATLEERGGGGGGGPEPVPHLPGNPPTCSGPYQSRPYLDIAPTRADVFDQTTGNFLKDNMSPVAIPIADLPPQLAADPYFQNYVGSTGKPTHMMLCNPASVLARYGYQLTLTNVYIDTGGDIVPAAAPWVVNGLPRPNVLQVGHATK